MPRKYFRKYLTDSATVRSHHLVAPFGSLVQHPNLWHLNRKSVAGGVAVGLLAGLVPGPLQMLTAALLAVPLRVNLPVALLTTLYTNPPTIVPLYVLAYRYGQLLLGAHRNSMVIRPFEMHWSDPAGSVRALLDWALSLGMPLVLGLPALALTLAALGYLAVRLGWRLHVMFAWRARSRRRAAARRGAP